MIFDKVMGHHNMAAQDYFWEDHTMIHAEGMLKSRP
jgi:hypothetical protein